MKLPHIVKSPLTYIVVGAAIIAFATGLFISARTPADSSTRTPADSAAAAPKEVVVLRTVTYRNPDGSWPSPVPTAAPPAARSDYEPTPKRVIDGIATMGKTLYVYDSEDIQLPPDVYVDKRIYIGTCIDRTNCPEFPVSVLIRGDYWVLIDRYGKPVLDWSDSPDYKPDAFEFLNE